MKNNADNPIYPQKRKEYIYSGCSEVTYYGLTKREYFAGLAMQALVPNTGMSLEEVAKTAVMQADILLNELEKPQNDE